MALAASLACASFAQSSNAPEKLVNMDTPALAEKGAVNATFGVRAFGGDEKQAYGTVQLDAGLGQGLGFVLRGTFSNTSTFTGNGLSIRHGGSDFEALLKYDLPDLPNLAIEAGLAIPNTPAQNTAGATGQVVYEYTMSQVRLYVGGREIANSRTTLAGLSGGISVQLGEGFDLFGDATWVVTGQNTYSTSTGRLQRNGLYGIGLRFRPTSMGRTNVSFEAGAGNALGGTTGMSLTPALGFNVGVFANVQVHF